LSGDVGSVVQEKEKEKKVKRKKVEKLENGTVRNVEKKT
jgi:hypothetical protein